MKRRQHRQRAAHLRALAAPVPSLASGGGAGAACVDSLSVAGEEDPGAALDGLVRPAASAPRLPERASQAGRSHGGRSRPA